MIAVKMSLMLSGSGKGSDAAHGRIPSSYRHAILPCAARSAGCTRVQRQPALIPQMSAIA